MTVITSQAYDRRDWASAFVNVDRELSDVSLKVARGVVPAGLRGTFYRNGPGRLERGGRMVHHPFDGDGMITAFRFGDGSVQLNNRFVRTAGWQEEEAAGRMLYRGVFGTQKPGGLLANAFDLRLKNIANTNVVRLGTHLLALWEAAEPHALDPETLETRELSLLDGVLQPGDAFSAHPRFDPGHHEVPCMVTFSVKTGPRSTIRLMEFASKGADAGRLLHERRDTFPGFAFLHDFAITPNWAVFLQNAISFNPLPFILGRKGAAQCLASQRSKRGHFWLVPRDSGAFAGQAPRVLEAPDGFVFHHLNAWEENTTVTIESIVYDDFPSIGPDQDFRQVDFNAIPEGRLYRTHLELDKGNVHTECLSERCCEFAMVNPAVQGLPARFAWMAAAEREQGNAPLQVIRKLDLRSGASIMWSAAPRGFVSEPIMVPSFGQEGELEDAGWVLSLIWNGARKASDLVILDAASLHELAVLELPLAIPPGLHGSWDPAPSSFVARSSE